ncbi:MAG: hypothetical protein KDA05_10080 [Phycisphaerales bacterium]|nr:hypothetical protein [Phycisphaerales bacterium]
MPLVTSGEYTGRPADGFTLCEQLGRMWAERSAFQPAGGEIGLTFAEPSVTTERANIYAAELPQREHRLDVAASITIDDDSRVAPNEPTRRFLVSVEGHAKTQREAVALLADLVRHLLNRGGVGRGWWDEPVTRHGVDLRGAVGFPTSPPPPPPPPATTWYHADLVLETVPGAWRDGRGGLLEAGVLNPLGPDGLVDTDHDDYNTNQELVDIALDAMGFAHQAAPAGLNTAVDGTTTMVAPGPLDWGNVRAMPELEALLARLGWAARLNNTGDEISVVRLQRAGEIFTPSTLVNDNAEPYVLDTSASVRPDRLIVTSGRTRTTIISERSLDDTDKPALVWCRFDEATGAWEDVSAASMIADFRDGPFGADGTTVAYAKLFSAVRLDESEREGFGRFVVLPEAPAVGASSAFGRSACIVQARGAVAEPDGQFRNADDEGDPIRLGGAIAIPGDGVFTLPTSMRYVRMPAGRGSHVDAVALADDDLTVLFAHEAHTGDADVDFYRTAWKVSVTAGVVGVTQITDPTELATTMADPNVVRVEAPFLRRIMAWPAADADPTPTNDAALDAIAKQIALARIAAADARSGTIVLRGLHDIAPGDLGGAVSGVTWNFADANNTVLAINQHDVPASFFESWEFDAGRSIAAGLERLSLPGSAVGVAEVRAGTTPGEAGGRVQLGPTLPEGGSGSRGREAASVAAVARSAMPEPATSLPSVFEASTLVAIIRGATSLGGNKWSYTWDEAKFNGTTYAIVGTGRSSDTHGLARNEVEYGNDGEDEESPGWNVADDLPDQTVFLTLKPIKAGTPVRMTQRLYDGDPTWFFNLANAVDIDTEPATTLIHRFKARITGSELVPSSDHQWLYDWEELENTGTGWQTKLGGRLSTIYVTTPFTADATANTIATSSSAAALPDHTAVQFTTTDTLPAPLAAATNYFGRWTTQGAGPYTLYPTKADSVAGTNAIDITSTGSGVHTLAGEAESSGKARNLVELGNPTGGYVGPGYELATIPPGFDLVPISAAVVVILEGPYQEEQPDETTAPVWYFQLANAVDGECSE